MPDTITAATIDRQDPDAHLASCFRLLDEITAGAHPSTRAAIDQLRENVAALADAHDERTGRIVNAARTVEAATAAAREAISVELGWDGP